MLDCLMNGGMEEWPNSRNGHICSFWQNWVVAIALLLQSPSPAGWQGVTLYMLNISFKEIQLEVKSGTL